MRASSSSAATEKPTRLAAAEARAAWRARRLTRLLERCGEAAAAEAKLVADAHGSAAYKSELLRVYVGARACASGVTN